MSYEATQGPSLVKNDVAEREAAIADGCGFWFACFWMQRKNDERSSVIHVDGYLVQAPKLNHRQPSIQRENGRRLITGRKKTRTNNFMLIVSLKQTSCLRLYTPRLPEIRYPHFKFAV